MTQLPDPDPTDGGRHPSIVERIATSTTPRVPFSVEFYPPRDEAAEDGQVGLRVGVGEEAFVEGGDEDDERTLPGR